MTSISLPVVSGSQGQNHCASLRADNLKDSGELLLEVDIGFIHYL